MGNSGQHIVLTLQAHMRCSVCALPPFNPHRMHHVSRDASVVQFYGAVLEQGQLLIVCELMEV